MNIKPSFSKITLVVIILFISLFRLTHISPKEISWDVLGYYIYLPATFVHHDPMLNNIDWLKKINEERDLAGTLYMVSTNDNNEPMYFFLMGLALFYLPFFGLASLYASIFNYPLDGFSEPYPIFLIIGGIIYTIIGLIFLRKILLHYFDEITSSILLICITLGTNYIHHLTIDNLATVNVLFMLTAINIWNTIQWYETQRKIHFYIIVGTVALITLVKPSEVFLFIIPLLWNINSFKSFLERLKYYFKNYKLLLTAFIIVVVIFLPQMLYWKVKTGYFIYDSYKNPGVGLDFFSPHVSDVLFSYRKGWLLYTPMMIFSLIGFLILYKKNRELFIPIFVYFIVSFWVISSWTEWWYGAAYSTRPLITTYPALAISFGYFINYIRLKRKIFQIPIYIILVFFIFLNQFQWWQLRNYILDPYRTTRDYYWAIFLKTHAPDNAEDLKSVYRDFSGKMEFNHPEKYLKPLYYIEYFDDTTQNLSSGKYEGYYRLEENQEFLPLFEDKYEEITQKDHFWAIAQIDIRFDSSFNETPPCLVISMERKEGPYGYKTLTLYPDSARCRWHQFTFVYQTPEIRSKHDRFKCYIWKRSKHGFDVDNFKLQFFKPLK